MLPVRIAVAGRERTLAEVDLPLDLDALLGAESAVASEWEVEIGFGKGRYLLSQARAHADVGFLGVEVASKYYRLALRRGLAAGLENRRLGPDRPGASSQGRGSRRVLHHLTVDP